MGVGGGCGSEGRGTGHLAFNMEYNTVWQAGDLSLRSAHMSEVSRGPLFHLNFFYKYWAPDPNKKYRKQLFVRGPSPETRQKKELRIFPVINRYPLW